MTLADRPALTLGLAAAVPLYVAELATATPEQRTAEARAAAPVIATHGDDLMFGGKHCAETFDALARGLAAAAYAPNGVDFAGLHFCVDQHAGCPNLTPPGGGQ